MLAYTIYLVDSLWAYYVYMHIVYIIIWEYNLEVHHSQATVALTIIVSDLHFIVTDVFYNGRHNNMLNSFIIAHNNMQVSQLLALKPRTTYKSMDKILKYYIIGMSFWQCTFLGKITIGFSQLFCICSHKIPVDFRPNRD